MLKYSPQEIRKWGFWEVLDDEAGVFMNGINILMKETTLSSPNPSTTEDTVS